MPGSVKLTITTDDSPFVIERFGSDSATFSRCMRYRYTLERILDPGNHAPLVFCMLNPSTADAEKNDRTVARCCAFALRWGFGRLIVVNAYAYRTPYPKVMFREAADGLDINGPDNDEAIFDAADQAMLYKGFVVAAWSALVTPERVARIIALTSSAGTLRALRVNQDGSPQHPLYIPGETIPVAWHPPPPKQPRRKRS